MLSWQTLLAAEKQKDYFVETLDYIDNQRANDTIVYPPKADVFNAFSATPFAQTKVVILGQDPYHGHGHGRGQAHGLSFSVKPGIKPPPSLANIYKELHQDIAGFTIPKHGYLQSWAEQGILLLNTVLTVEAGKAHSHKHLGWEQFTAVVIDAINNHGNNVVFLLWGAHAQKKGQNIDQQKHLVLHAPHPSPLSAYRGFIGCQHFSKTNKYLLASGINPINWQVPPLV